MLALARLFFEEAAEFGWQSALARVHRYLMFRIGRPAKESELAVELILLGEFSRRTLLREALDFTSRTLIKNASINRAPRTNLPLLILCNSSKFESLAFELRSQNYRSRLIFQGFEPLSSNVSSWKLYLDHIATDNSPKSIWNGFVTQAELPTVQLISFYLPILARRRFQSIAVRTSSNDEETQTILSAPAPNAFSIFVKFSSNNYPFWARPATFNQLLEEMWPALEVEYVSEDVFWWFNNIQNTGIALGSLSEMLAKGVFVRKP